MKPCPTVATWLLISGFTFGLTHAWKPIVASDFSATLNLGGKAQDSSETGPITLLQESKIEALSPQIGGHSISRTPIVFEQDHVDYASSYDQNQGVGAHIYEEDHCAVKKYAFNHDGTVYYNNKIPELSQMTICFWMRFTNHSGDHVILTYAVHEVPRELQIWVANARNSSFLSMAIKGQQIYRLNYPLLMRKWHHTCTSWNGKTGEWQVWLKAERIGRGFHNGLVGHKIPANGKLYSGGPSFTGEISQGLHFEITLIQVYHIALSAGKAHRDHKHHHAHHFDHEGQELIPTTRPPPTINRPLPMHSLLANGQIPTRVKINLANPNQAQQSGNSQPTFDLASLPEGHQAVTIHTNFVNGQINAGHRLVSQQLLGLTAAGAVGSVGAAPTTTLKTHSTLNNPANVQYVDETETHLQFKRQTDKDTASSRVSKRRSHTELGHASKEKTLSKRGLVLLEDGSVVNDDALDDDFKYDGLAEFGGKQFKHDLNAKMNVADEVTEYDREPAEEEVKAVMALCSTCDSEPFEGAIVFAWKNVKGDMDNALRGYSVGGCGHF